MLSPMMTKLSIYCCSDWFPECLGPLETKLNTRCQTISFHYHDFETKLKISLVCLCDDHLSL